MKIAKKYFNFFNSPYRCNVIAGEGSELLRPLAGAHVPPIVTGLHDNNDVPIQELQLILVLRGVAVTCTVPGVGNNSCYSSWLFNYAQLLFIMLIYS